jgi:hypothetical protein
MIAMCMSFPRLVPENALFSKQGNMIAYLDGLVLKAADVLL